MAGILEKDLLTQNVTQFATFLRALDECAPEIQEVAKEMMKIISSEDVDPEDKAHAVEVVVEALFPNLTTDIRGFERGVLNTDEAKAAEGELDAQEASFAERVSTVMRDRGMTQGDLAAAAGVTQPAISNILNRNCRPQRRTVEKIALALGVKPEELWPND